MYGFKDPYDPRRILGIRIFKCKDKITANGLLEQVINQTPTEVRTIRIGDHNVVEYGYTLVYQDPILDPDVVEYGYENVSVTSRGFIWQDEEYVFYIDSTNVDRDILVKLVEGIEY